MKQWIVSASAYNSHGGHATLSLLSYFFRDGLPHFGTALQEITTTFHFAHPGPPRTSLEGLFADFHAAREKLPKVVFRRSRQSATIDFASEFMSGRDLEPCGVERMDWFNHGAHEIVENLELLRSRFKPSDDFDLAGFLAHCRSRLDQLPSSESQFTEVFGALKLQDKLWRASLSDWDRLGIDFRDFHPAAKTILNDPFYWDGADDFAPNGNDAGADVLENYRQWLQGHSAADSPEFLPQLLKRWKLEGDELISAQAAVGLAFADIKLRGECHSSLRPLAIAGLAKLSELAEHLGNDALREDWSGARAKMEAKLNEITAS